MDTTSSQASAAYNASNKVETITETIEQHLNPGTKDFAIIKTTNKATIDENGDLAISQTTTSLTSSGKSTTSTSNPSISIFSSRIASIIDKAVSLRKGTGLSWSTTLMNEYNQVQVSQAWKNLGWNVGTIIAFPPSFVTKGQALYNAINLGLSGYSILDAVRGVQGVNGFEHSNIFWSIYQWNK